MGQIYGKTLRSVLEQHVCAFRQFARTGSPGSRRCFRRFALVCHNCFRPSSPLRHVDIVSFRYFRFQAHRSMSAPPCSSRCSSPPLPPALCGPVPLYAPLAARTSHGTRCITNSIANEASDTSRSATGGKRFSTVLTRDMSFLLIGILERRIDRYLSC